MGNVRKKMNGTQKEANTKVAKKAAAGAVKNSGKTTENEWLAIRKGPLNSYLYKLV